MDYGINTSSIISEINKARTQPKTYSKKIENLLNNFEGNVLKIPNKKNRLITLEGVNAFKESIQFLNSQSPLNKLDSDLNLSEAAEAIAEQFSRTREMNNINQVNIHKIIDRYGTVKGNIGISVDFGNDNAEMLIISLITDDGRKQRKNRKMIFDNNYNKIGCSSKISKFHKKVSVILYAIDFITGKSLNDKYNHDINLDYDYKRSGKVNYINENVAGLNLNIDLFTEVLKEVIIILLKKEIILRLEMIVIIMIILLEIFIKLIRMILIWKMLEKLKKIKNLFLKVEKELKL